MIDSISPSNVSAGSRATLVRWQERTSRCLSNSVRRVFRTFWRPCHLLRPEALAPTSEWIRISRHSAITHVWINFPLYYIGLGSSAELFCVNSVFFYIYIKKNSVWVLAGWATVRAEMKGKVHCRTSAAGRRSFTWLPPSMSPSVQTTISAGPKGMISAESPAWTGYGHHTNAIGQVLKPISKQRQCSTVKERFSHGLNCPNYGSH